MKQLNLHASVVAVVAACLVMCWPRQASAQAWPEIGLHTSFNGDDVSIGIQGGVLIPNIDLSTRFDFTFRPDVKRVHIPHSTISDLTYQYLESRYWLGLELEKRITFFEVGDLTYLGLTGMMMGGYTFGRYSGTRFRPSDGLTFRARLGPYIMAEDFFMARLGYEYMPMETPSIPDHRLFIAFSFFISDI